MSIRSRSIPFRPALIVAALTSVGCAALVMGCGGGGDAPVATAPAADTSAASFSSVSVAVSDGEKRAVRASTSATIGGQTMAIDYQTILRTGDQRGSDPNLNTYGLILDNQMKPILAADGSKTIANSNDFSSILSVGQKLFTVSHMEDIPGALYLTELEQDAQSGLLSAKSTQALDLSGINGIVSPCAGSVTPWQTHLGSEEDSPDARSGRPGYMATYFGGGTTVGGDASRSNLYFWGYPVEVAVTEAGTPTVTKHYSMGRMGHELSYVMPDQRTVYESDDETNTSYYLYMADKAADLSAGTLYAMKLSQTTPANTSDLIDGTVSWIKLGHATDAEIKATIDSGIKFTDIFDTATPANGACPAGFKAVHATPGLECLSLKAGKEQAAAFLETRRYAGYVGATTELRKEEGMSFDPEAKRMYVSYSFLERGMEDNRKLGVADTQYDIGTSNDVKALFNHCGAVYAYDMGTDATIGSDFVAKSIHGVLAGIMTTLSDPKKLNPSTIDAYPSSSPYAGNACSVDGIANPDNITFMPGQKTLLIGEDSDDGHQNDMTWAYNIETKKLTRIQTTPYGSEVTGLYYHPNINNHGYIMSIVQHPYGESDQNKVSANSAERHSYLGYLGPLPPAPVKK